LSLARLAAGATKHAAASLRPRSFPVLLSVES